MHDRILDQDQGQDQPTRIDLEQVFEQAMREAHEQAMREAAERLAEAHYRVEPGTSRIYRLRGGKEDDRTIRLLEVNSETVPSGIVPIGFAPHPPSGLPFSSVIVEITPEEFADLQEGRLRLPDGWEVGEPFEKPGQQAPGREP